MASVDPVFATLLLSIMVLAAGVALCIAVLDKSSETQKSVFAVVGVLFGLLAAGGLGSLFAKQAADTSAEQAAKSSATQAANQVKDDVADQVDQALDQPPPEQP